PKARRRYVRISEPAPNERSSENARRATAALARSRCSETSPRPRKWSRPAKWKSADSSASRSHSRSGATAASSARTSSENDTLELQEPPLVGRAERAVGPETTDGDDAVARDDQREPVRRAHGTDRTLCVGMARERGDLAVRRRLAVRDRAHRV